MKRLLLAATLAALTPSVPGAQTLCEYQGPGPHWMVARDARGGVEVRIEDPAHAREILSHWPDSRALAARNLLPVGANYWPQAEYLARQAGSAVFCAGPGRGSRGSWTAQTLAPLPLDGAWRGADPLSCLRSFAQAAGLEVVVPQPGLWLIGAPEVLEHAALEVFAYPIDVTLQPLQSEAAVGDLERALLAHLPIRNGGSFALVGLGYYAIPGEGNTYLVVATQGAFTNPSDGEELSVHAFKVRVTREGGRVRVECMWDHGVNGPLLAGVQEDFDGDGLQDFYFQEAGDAERPSLILSGADGSVIAAVFTDTLVVESRATGPKRFSVKALWGQEGKVRVYRYSPENKTLAVVEPRVAGANVSGVSQGLPAPPLDRPVDKMVAELGSPGAVRIYALPGFLPQHPPGAELIKVHGSPVWGWFLNKNPRQAIEQIPANLAMHVVYKYLSPGYFKEQEREKAAERK